MKELSLPGDVADEHPVAVLVLVGGHVLGAAEKVRQLGLVHALHPLRPAAAAWRKARHASSLDHEGRNAENRRKQKYWRRLHVQIMDSWINAS